MSDDLRADVDAVADEYAERCKAEFGAMWDAVRTMVMDGEDDPDVQLTPWAALSEHHKMLASFLTTESHALGEFVIIMTEVTMHAEECGV